MSKVLAFSDAKQSASERIVEYLRLRSEADPAWRLEQDETKPRDAEEVGASIVYIETREVAVPGAFGVVDVQGELRIEARAFETNSITLVSVTALKVLDAETGSPSDVEIGLCFTETELESFRERIDQALVIIKTLNRLGASEAQ